MDARSSARLYWVVRVVMVVSRSALSPGSVQRAPAVHGRSVLSEFNARASVDLREV